MLEEPVAELGDVAGVERVRFGISFDVFFSTERCGDGVEVIVKLDEFFDFGDRQQIVEVSAGFFNCLACFANDRVRLELGSEDLASKVAKFIERTCAGTKRRRGRNRRSVTEGSVGLVHCEGAAETAKQHRDIGALGAVVGVELVENNVLEGVGVVGRPQVAVFAS